MEHQWLLAGMENGNETGKLFVSFLSYTAVILLGISLTDLNNLGSFKTCTWIFVVCLFPKVIKRTLPKHSLIEKCVIKLFCFHTVEYSSVGERMCYKAVQRGGAIINEYCLGKEHHLKNYLLCHSIYVTFFLKQKFYRL